MLKWFQVLCNQRTGLTGLRSRDTPHSQKVNGLVEEKFLVGETRLLVLCCTPGTVIGEQKCATQTSCV